MLRNLQRVAKLFVDEVGLRRVPDPLGRPDAEAYPLLPRHLTLAAGADDRHPGVLPRARAERGPWRHASGFLREVARFAVPAGTAAGLGVLASYLFALNVVEPAVLERARRSRPPCSSLVGLYLILVLEAPGGCAAAPPCPCCARALLAAVLRRARRARDTRFLRALAAGAGVSS